MNNPFTNGLVAVVFIVLFLNAFTPGYGQQPAAAAKPATPPAVAAQPASPSPPIGKQAVQATSEEQGIMTAAWAGFENAQLRLQIAIDQVVIAHPGWKYDLTQKVFYVELPAAAPVKPAEHPSPAAK